jgi:chitinase
MVLSSSALVFVSLGVWFASAHLNHSWEYPTKSGIGCNSFSPDDSANFLTFLEFLRAMDGAEKLIISAAVSLQPFLDSTGKPMTDVSRFAKVLDHIGSFLRIA